MDTFKIFNTKRALDIPINERLLRFLPKEDSLPYILCAGRGKAQKRGTRLISI